MFILSQNQDEIFRGDFFDRYTIVKEGKSYFIAGKKHGADDLTETLRINLAEYPTIGAAKSVLQDLLVALSKGENMIFPERIIGSGNEESAAKVVLY